MKSATVEYANGLNVSYDVNPSPISIFSLNNNSNFGMNWVRKGVESICLVACNNSFLAIESSAGQSCNNLKITSGTHLLSSGFKC